MEKGGSTSDTSGNQEVVIDDPVDSSRFRFRRACRRSAGICSSPRGSSGSPAPHRGPPVDGFPGRRTLRVASLLVSPYGSAAASPACGAEGSPARSRQQPRRPCRVPRRPVGRLRCVPGREERLVALERPRRRRHSRRRRGAPRRGAVVSRLGAPPDASGCIVRGAEPSLDSWSPFRHPIRRSGRPIDAGKLLLRVTDVMGAEWANAGSVVHWRLGSESFAPDGSVVFSLNRRTRHLVGSVRVEARSKGVRQQARSSLAANAQRRLSTLLNVYAETTRHPLGDIFGIANNQFETSYRFSPDLRTMFVLHHSEVSGAEEM